MKSPLSQSHRLSTDDLDQETEDSGEIEITADLISAFRDSLTKNKIQIQFFCGPWTDLPRLLSSQSAGPYDMVLTSETIYNISSMPSLIELLRHTTQPDLEARAANLSLTSAQVSRRPTLCLVGAKVVYFGVGGSSTEFKRKVEATGAKIQTVMERKTGVGREVLQITW